MALNPVAYTENVVRSFLRYQLTAYPFADPRLHAQMRALLSLDATRRSPLLKGPYVSLSRPFRQGATASSLVGEGLLHPHLGERIRGEITHFYSHQERAMRAIAGGRTTLVSTGTGSGKTECFLYPIVSQCLTLRDEGAPPGISAVIVYPMNALAEDQLMRLRGVLAGTGIPFGIYVGKTPERETDLVGVKLGAGASRADYEARLARAQREGSGETVYPPAVWWRLNRAYAVTNNRPHTFTRSRPTPCKTPPAFCSTTPTPGSAGTTSLPSSGSGSTFPAPSSRISSWRRGAR